MEGTSGDIEVRHASGKGRCYFAKHHIARGACILAESPLMEARNNVQAVLRAFRNLSAPDQLKFKELHKDPAAGARQWPQDWATSTRAERNIISTYAINAFDHKVCHFASRFNHSCLPNVDYYYNPDQRKMYFHAVRAIKNDEELTINYIGDDIFNPCNQRRARLLNDYGFNCNCEACTIDVGLSDRNRTNFVQSELRLNLYIGTGSSASLKQGLTRAWKMGDLLISEGLLTHQLARCYQYAAKCSRTAEAAILYAEKEVDIYRCCLGEDHDLFRDGNLAIQKLQEVVQAGTPFDQNAIPWA